MLRPPPVSPTYMPPPSSTAVLNSRAESIRVSVCSGPLDHTPPPSPSERLLVTDTSVSVRCSPRLRMPAPSVANPSMMSIPLMDTSMSTPPLDTENTRLVSLPLTVSPPSGPLITTESVTDSWPLVSTMTPADSDDSNVMTSAPAEALASMMA